MDLIKGHLKTLVVETNNMEELLKEVKINIGISLKKKRLTFLSNFNKISV